MKLKVGLIDYSTCCFEVLMQKTTSIIFILLCFLSSCSFESKTEFPAFDKEIRVDGEQSGMKKIHTWGSLGNGPGEFLQPIITYAHENTFGLNDVNIQMLAVMSLKGNGNAIEIEELSRKKTPYKRVQGELNPADYNFVRLDEQHFVSLLCGKDGSFFSLLDANLQPLQRFGESPVGNKISV